MPFIQTLENTTLEKIAAVFNESFSDYIVPLNLTREQLENKIYNDSIQTAFSAGAFEDDQLVGFILHGYDVINNEKVIYNAGTGVIPSHRGKKLTRQLYDFIFPVLQSDGISKVQLEVITGNQPAIKTYQDIGFQITRELDCYKGAVDTGETLNDYNIQPLENDDWELMQSFWDWNPSWQNSMTAMRNLAHNNASFGIYADQHLLGYIIYNPLSKRVQQFAVHKSHRGKGVGRYLFHHIAHNFGRDISIINVEHGAAETGRFLKSIGLEIYVKQYEMEYRMK